MEQRIVSTFKCKSNDHVAYRIIDTDEAFDKNDDLSTGFVLYVKTEQDKDWRPKSGHQTDRAAIKAAERDAQQRHPTVIVF